MEIESDSVSSSITADMMSSCKADEPPSSLEELATIGSYAGFRTRLEVEFSSQLCVNCHLIMCDYQDHCSQSLGLCNDRELDGVYRFRCYSLLFYSSSSTKSYGLSLPRV